MPAPVLRGNPPAGRFAHASPLLRKGEGWWPSPSMSKGRTTNPPPRCPRGNDHPSPLMIKGELKGVQIARPHTTREPPAGRFAPASSLLRKGEGWWPSPSMSKGRTTNPPPRCPTENNHPSPSMSKGEQPPLPLFDQGGIKGGSDCPPAHYARTPCGSLRSRVPLASQRGGMVALPLDVQWRTTNPPP